MLSAALAGKRIDVEERQLAIRRALVAKRLDLGQRYG
jgi:hypothetical protein